MADIREQIFARMEEVLRSQVPDLTVKRMDTTFDEAEFPGLALLDGNEQNQDAQAFGLAPLRMLLQPVIAIFGITSGQPGPFLSAMRVKILKALLFDDQLAGLCAAGRGGRITYEGCTTESQLGEAIMADMILNFSLIYILKPQAL